MIAFRGLHSDLRPYAEYTCAIAKAYGVHPRVTSVRRTWVEQDALYRNYLAGRSRYPANPPGQSAHEHGLAWDSTVAPEHQDWWTAVRRWVGWQVYDHDAPHAELPGWRQVV